MNFQAELHKVITIHFNLGELKTLCLYLGVDYENLEGEGKENKTRELVQFLERRGRINDLRDAIKKQRPNILWKDAPQKTQSQQEDPMKPKKTRVLILDDEEGWRDILSEIVNELGFVSVTVGNLPSARDHLAKEDFDIIITDLYLKRDLIGGPAQGLWLIDDIREMHHKGKHLPKVIVVSGSKSMGVKEAQKLFEYPVIVDAFFEKPDFSDRKMKEALRRAVRINQELVAEKEKLTYSLINQFWYIEGFPASKEISISSLEKLKDEIDVVLISANEEELKAVVGLLDPYPNRRHILKTSIRPDTYYLGRFGEYRAVVTKCRQGAIGEGSVILAAEHGIREWQPRAVIMVGVAFGMDPQKQAMADVLVASQIISYEEQRKGQETVYRGSIIPTDITLLNQFSNVPDWSFILPDGESCKIQIGPLLSGEKLVDDADFKAELFTQFPQAIGGEMEGAGLFAVARRLGVPWMVVKSICDWGDGKKHDGYQPLAAATAASYVHHVLSQKIALDSLKKYNP